LSAIGACGLDGMRFSASLCSFGLGRFGGLRKAWIAAWIAAAAFERLPSPLRRDPPQFIGTAVRGASVFKANLRYFSGAWVADVRSAAFVVIAVRKPAFELAVFIMRVSQAKSCG